MARVLQIENFSTTTTINLLADTGISVFIGEGGNRPLKSGVGTVTRVFSFRITASTKALARTAANSFISSLTKAIDWHVDPLQSESWFLREAADGETAVRSLIVNFEASANSDGSAIDAYQTMNTAVYVDVALTLQNHREEVAKTTLTETNETTKTAIGAALTLSGSANTAKSRLFVPIISSLSGSIMTKVWVGLRSITAAGFRPIWFFDHAEDLLNGTTETTETGSYGTNICKVEFTTTTMLPRARLNVYTQYNAFSESAASGSAAGRYVALLRYKCLSAVGETVLVRIGTDMSNGAPISYNEPRMVINDDENWWFVNLGVVSIPSHSIRQEELATDRIASCNLRIDAQCLNGTPDLILDTITFIPYDHYIYIEKCAISTLYTTTIYSNEDLQVGTITKVVATGNYAVQGTIVEKNDFMYPPATTSVVMVYAAEKADGQFHANDLDNGAIQIYEAFDAYNAG